MVIPIRKKLGNHIFNLVTLTFDLDHQTHLSFYQGQSLYEILCPYVKRFGRESADELTDRRKHKNTGPILLPRPLTREAMSDAFVIKLRQCTVDPMAGGVTNMC